MWLYILDKLRNLSAGCHVIGCNYSLELLLNVINVCKTRSTVSLVATECDKCL